MNTHYQTNTRLTTGVARAESGVSFFWTAAGLSLLAACAGGGKTVVYRDKISVVTVPVPTAPIGDGRPSLSYATNWAEDGMAAINEDEIGAVKGVLLFDDDETANSEIVLKVGATSSSATEPAQAGQAAMEAGAAAAGDAPEFIKGDYGSFRFERNDAEGKWVWTYDLDESSSAVQSLGPGDRLYEMLTMVANDGTADSDVSTAVVAIDGVDDLATIKTLIPHSVTAHNTEAVSTITGTYVTGDVDTPDTEVWARAGTSRDTALVAASDVANSGKGAEIPGTYGSLYLKRDGTWSYDLDNTNPDVAALGDRSPAMAEVFTFQALSDGKAGQQRTLNIAIKGVDPDNTAPTQTVPHTSSTITAVANDYGSAEVTMTVSGRDAEADRIYWRINPVGDTIQWPTIGAKVAGSNILWGSMLYTHNTLTFTTQPGALASIADGESVELTFCLYIQEERQTISSWDIWILTLHGVDDRPHLSVRYVDQSVVEPKDGAPIDPVASGSVSLSDPDIYPTPQTGHVIQGRGAGQEFKNGSDTANRGKGADIAGSYGTLYLKADRKWVYELYDDTTVEGEALQALNADSTGVTDDFSIRVDNDALTEVTISINVTGSNDLPTSADASASLEAGYAVFRDFVPQHFHFADPDADSALAAIVITEDPKFGSLAIQRPGQSKLEYIRTKNIAASDIEHLIYTYANALDHTDFQGFDSFGFKVSDGITESAESYTFLIEIA